MNFFHYLTMWKVWPTDGKSQVCLSDMWILLEMPLAYHRKILGFSLFFLTKEKTMFQPLIILKCLSLLNQFPTPFLCGSWNVNLADTQSWASGSGNLFTKHCPTQSTMAAQSVHIPVWWSTLPIWLPSYWHFLRNLSIFMIFYLQLHRFTKWSDAASDM